MSGFKKTEHPEYARHAGSSAVLNIDAASFNRYRDERARIMKLEHLSEDVGALQKDMQDIKTLLQQLVNGKTNG